MFITSLKQIHQCQNTFITAASFSELPESIWNNANGKLLFYLDCFGLKSRELDFLLSSAYQKIQSGDLLALFNFTGSTEIESEVLNYGVRGFFYPDDTPADFCKGTCSILNGEVWLSRRRMSEMILAGIHPPVQDNYHAKADMKHLTAREKEVLAHLVSGGSNETIAAELHISIHTLRTHLYHIYRKIDVHNRMQASCWAEKNL